MVRSADDPALLGDYVNSLPGYAVQLVDSAGYVAVRQRSGAPAVLARRMGDGRDIAGSQAVAMARGDVSGRPYLALAGHALAKLRAPRRECGRGHAQTPATGDCES